MFLYGIVHSFHCLLNKTDMPAIPQLLLPASLPSFSLLRQDCSVSQQLLQGDMPFMYYEKQLLYGIMKTRREFFISLIKQLAKMIHEVLFLDPTSCEPQQRINPVSIRKGLGKSQRGILPQVKDYFQSLVEEEIKSL